MKFVHHWGGIAVLIAMLTSSCQTVTPVTDTGGGSVTKGLCDDTKGASVEKRCEYVALVIGNSSYDTGTSLVSPKHDAEDVTKSLRSQGYKVYDHVDLTKSNMDKEIDSFAEKIREDQTVLFFFSGHGVQSGNKNYLVPVDGNVDADDVGKQLVATEDVMQKIAKAKNSLIVVDACRSKLPTTPTKGSARKTAINPLAPVPSEASRAGSVDGGKIMKVLYAAGDGGDAFANRSNERNSLLTKHLLSNLDKQLTASNLIQQTAVGVEEDSLKHEGRVQTPHSLGRVKDFCPFRKCDSTRLPPPNGGAQSTEEGDDPPEPPPI